jgi:hypothetical protein
MIDDLGVAVALDAYFNYGGVLDDGIEDFLKAKSAEWVLRAAGRTRLRRAEEAHHEAASLLTHLLTTEKLRLTVGRRRLLKEFLLFEVGEEALVHEGYQSRIVLDWFVNWPTGGIGSAGRGSICRIGGQYWCCDFDIGYCAGPYRTLKGAMAQWEFALNDGIQEVNQPGKTAAQLARMLPVDRERMSPGHLVQLNGEPWVVGDDLTLTPQAPATKPPAAGGRGSRRRR